MEVQFVMLLEGETRRTFEVDHDTSILEIAQKLAPGIPINSQTIIFGPVVEWDSEGKSKRFHALDTLEEINCGDTICVESEETWRIHTYTSCCTLLLKKNVALSVYSYAVDDVEVVKALLSLSVGVKETPSMEQYGFRKPQLPEDPVIRYSIKMIEKGLEKESTPEAKRFFLLSQLPYLTTSALKVCLSTPEYFCIKLLNNDKMNVHVLKRPELCQHLLKVSWYGPEVQKVYICDHKLGFRTEVPWALLKKLYRVVVENGLKAELPKWSQKAKEEILGPQ